MIGAIARSRMPNRFAVRMARLQSGPGTLVWQPEPPVAGDRAAARRLVNGLLLFEGRLVETSAPDPWALEPPDDVWRDHLHGHGWLDDAATAEDGDTWKTLSDWAWTWIEHYGDGSGPGWQPELAARRLTRWIAYSARFLAGQPTERSHAFFAALGTHARYLELRWPRAETGIARIEALCGLVYAKLSLEGSGAGGVRRALAQLGELAQRMISADGAVASRNPEDLARITTLLDWTASGIADAGLNAHAGHLAALQRGLGALSTVRYGDGRIARFHGSRSGRAWQNTRTTGSEQRVVLGDEASVMGYLKLSMEDAELIVDGALPAKGSHALTAHASALALEFWHKGQPIIVNCVSGAGFGRKFANASRRGAAHSTLELGGRCASTLSPVKGERRGASLTMSGKLTARINEATDGSWALCESTTYQKRFGLNCERRLHLSADGLMLSGEDTALAPSAATRTRASEKFPEDGPPCPFVARFHLHPDIEARMALAGRGVALKLPDGSHWLMTADQPDITLEPSIFFDDARPTPRATQQIVVRTAVMEYWGRISWSLARKSAGPSD